MAPFSSSTQYPVVSSDSLRGPVCPYPLLLLLVSNTVCCICLSPLQISPSILLLSLTGANQSNPLFYFVSVSFHSSLRFAMGLIAHVRFRGDDYSEQVLFTKGIFHRNFNTVNGKTGSLYIPDEMKKDFSEEKLTETFKEMASKTTVWHSSYKSGYDVPLFFLSGTGVHIPYHIDNCERGISLCTRQTEEIRDGRQYHKHRQGTCQPQPELRPVP